jgi:WXG100 family type VII secretion target
MAKFTVDTDAVRAKAEAVNGLSQEYSGLSKQLRNVATSMGQAYESADNKEYITRVNECCDNLDKMAVKLANTAQLLRTQSGEYDSTEQNNLQQASKLPG